MNNFIKINIKFLFFTITILLFLFPLANEIHKYEKKYEIRSSLIKRNDIKKYNYFLIGDSVFCSFYINEESYSIWNKFKHLTGQEMFPGALNGAKIGDYISAANYISQEIKENSIVFINIIPTRFIFRDKNEKNNYDQKFSELKKEKFFLVHKLINYFDNRYLEFAIKYLKGNKTDRNENEHFNRVWNIDGDFAEKRYLSGYENIKKKPQLDDFKILKEINEIFVEKKISAVFVLTPLNKQLIYTYSDSSEAEKIYSNLSELRDNTKKYLNKINASTIDIFEKVPANCFADLLHTNACGDEIIARALANYALRSEK